jgi:hypothetical protein
VKLQQQNQPSVGEQLQAEPVQTLTVEPVQE